MQPDDQWRPPRDGSAAGATPEPQGPAYGQGGGVPWGQQHGFGQQAGYIAPDQGSYGSAPEYPVYPGTGAPPGYGGPTQAYTQGYPGYDPYQYGGYSGFVPYGGYGAHPPPPSGATVITGAVIQIVQGVLGVLAGLLIALVGDFIDENTNELSAGAASVHAATSAIIAIGIVILLISVFVIVLAALIIQRHRWALITSVVLQSIWVLLSIVGIASSDQVGGGTVIGILVAAAVVVLFLLPSSSVYIASRQVSWQPPR
jgi:hypothetical protein